MDYENKPQSQALVGNCIQGRMPTPLESLRERQSKLTTELKETTEAIEALEANPEIANVLEKIGRALRTRY